MTSVQSLQEDTWPRPEGGGVILFIHIPMACDTFLRDVIRSRYRDHQWLPVYGAELSLAWPDLSFIEAFKRSRESLRLVFGHFSFGVHRLLDVEPCYATVVSEPCSRVVRLYRQMAADPSSPLGERIRAGLSLADLVRSHETEMTNNHMCRMLAGCVPVPRVPISGRRCLEDAKDNLARDFISVHACSDLVRKTAAMAGMDIPRSSDSTAHETLGRVPEIDVESREVVAEHNRLDIELYEWIRARTSRPTAHR